MEIRQYLINKLGLNYNDNQVKELYVKLEAAARGFDFEDTDNFISWLIAQPLNNKQTEKLAAYLTVGETYFLREKKALDYLEFEYLPKLIRKRRGVNQHLKIWSAGCASGEEPYSIAIMLKRIIPDIADWDITIMATDINSNFLEKAKAGIYTKWSFRGISSSFMSRHFKEVGKNKYQISEEIKKLVTFSFFNIASDAYPSEENNTVDFDIILCRNVFIYFSNKVIASVTLKFYKSLAKQGVFIVSPVEVSKLISSKFHTVSYNRITIYKKGRKDILEKKKASVHLVSPKYLDNNKLSAFLNINKNQIDNARKKVLPIFTPKNNILPSAKIPTEVVAKNEEAVIPNYQDLLIMFKEGLFDEVEKLIENVLISNQNYKSSYILLLAKVKANKGDLNESEKLCLQTIELDKTNTGAHYLLATVYGEQGKVKEAVSSLVNTLFLDPDFALGHFLLGNIHLRNGSKSESSKHFSNAIKSLSKSEPNEIIAESDGLTVGRLLEMIKSIKI